MVLRIKDGPQVQRHLGTWATHAADLARGGMEVCFDLSVGRQEKLRLPNGGDGTPHGFHALHREAQADPEEAQWDQENPPPFDPLRIERSQIQDA